MLRLLLTLQHRLIGSWLLAAEAEEQINRVRGLLAAVVVQEVLEQEPLLLLLLEQLTQLLLVAVVLL
jgi:hypothetical protein